VHVQQQQNISIANLSKKVQKLQELLEGQEKRKSPTKLSSTTYEPPPSKRSRVETAPAGVSPVAAAVSTGVSSTIISSAVAATVVKRTLYDTLRYGSKAASIAADSNKDIELRHVLIELHRTGQYQNRSLEDTMYREIADNNMSKYKAVMRLVEKSWTLEQQEKLRTKSLSNIELMDVAVGVENQCLKTMAGLEGRDGLGRTKAKMIGLGQRYLVWEKKDSHPIIAPIYETAFKKAVAYFSPSKSRSNADDT
jgi:hypothetical protein